MRIDRQQVRAVLRRVHALFALSVCAGLVAAASPCAVFCSDADELPDVAAADTVSHCGGSSRAQQDAPPAAPADCCGDDCDACGIDRVSILAPIVATQAEMPDHGLTLVSSEWSVVLDRHPARSRARSPDDARAHLLDVLSQTTTLLI